MTKPFFDNWTSQLKKGALTYIILKFLYKRRYYGYELLTDIKELVNIDATDGTIYPLLNRLYKEGLLTYEWIEQGSGIPRKYYTLTKMGRDTLVPIADFWAKLTLAIAKL
jgi:PadR family transcriptional regulator, regulatory protein PadR